MKISHRVVEFWIACTLLFYVFALQGCGKLVEAPAPVTSVNAQNVYTSDATSIAALTGIYSKMSNNTLEYGGFTSLPIVAALSADELSLYSGATGALRYFYTNSITSQNTGTFDIWLSTYPFIFYANSAIAGLSNSSGLTPSIKQQLIGEAKFLRAFYYFYLVNFYGDVPLVTSTDYTTNALLPRTPKAQVYTQIIADLHDAQDLLSTNYLDGTLLNVTAEKTRPTKWAAVALLARVYLYAGNWAGADSAASAVIGGNYSLSPLNSVFLRNSSEAIWQLQPVTSTTKNTEEAIFYIIPTTGLSPVANPVCLSPYLLNSFEPNDLRVTSWIGKTIVSGTNYYYPFKYKINNISTPVSEYIMMMRLGEQYLIRAEARAEEGNTMGAQSDLNIIRARASLGGTTASSQSDLLNSVLHERQVELFTEWGNRWMDIKRTGNVDAVMGTGGVCAAKGGVWNTNWQLYPVPYSELFSNPKLVQNAGY